MVVLLLTAFKVQELTSLNVENLCAGVSSSSGPSNGLSEFRGLPRKSMSMDKGDPS
jgi:hypothetical protein